MPVKLDFAHSLLVIWWTDLIHRFTSQLHIPKGKKRASGWQAEFDLHNSVKGTSAGTFQTCWYQTVWKILHDFWNYNCLLHQQYAGVLLCGRLELKVGRWILLKGSAVTCSDNTWGRTKSGKCWTALDCCCAVSCPCAKAAGPANVL